MNKVFISVVLIGILYSLSSCRSSSFTSRRYTRGIFREHNKDWETKPQPALARRTQNKDTLRDFSFVATLTHPDVSISNASLANENVTNRFVKKSKKAEDWHEKLKKDSQNDLLIHSTKSPGDKETKADWRHMFTGFLIALLVVLSAYLKIDPFKSIVQS